MDEDIRKDLKDVGSHLEDVARQVSSPKSSMESITVMRECLKNSVNVLDTYLRIQKMRYH